MQDFEVGTAILKRETVGDGGIQDTLLGSGCAVEMCSGSEAGSYLRLIAFCITEV